MANTSRPAMKLHWRLGVALALFGLGLGGKIVFASRIDEMRSREAATLPRPLPEFPRRLGAWVGTDLETNEKMLRDIKSDDHLERRYEHPSGEKLVLWCNFSGRSLDQYHYPAVCLTGAGWEEDESRRQQWNSATPSGNPCPMVSMYFSKQQNKQYVHYWYYLLGEDPVDRMMRKASTYARAFLRGRRNASLTVEVFSSSPTPDKKLLDEFAAKVAAELDQWMPQGTQACCELGATY